MKLLLERIAADPMPRAIDPGNVVGRMVEPLSPDTIGSIVDGRELLQELLAYAVLDAMVDDDPDGEAPTLRRIQL